MVVLAPAIEGTKGAHHLAEVFDISEDEGGFFFEEHTEVAPVSTARDGIFIAGCAQGPKDIQGSVAQGQAAAGMILSRLVPGEKLPLEPVSAEVDQDLCSTCKLCMGLCCYKAITCDDKKEVVTVNELLCRGCGVCAAACPSAAIKANHFTDAQISAEIKELAKGS
jgi:heterodisulfide reductase subunit A